MTHAESQDLLLDLAYGELDAARAAEVEGHLSSCTECRTQKAALEEARRMAAPLRELEEPSPGFDERILRAARAQAQLEHEGNVGQVIEVTGTVRPLGMEAARIDAHGPVKARPAQRQRPAWVKRAAAGGAVAAAAALALVIGNTLETRRNRERVEAASKDDYQIRVAPAAERPVADALRDADARRDAAQSPGVAPGRRAVDVTGDAPALSEPPPLVGKQVPMSSGPGRLRGSGGDAAGSLSKRSAATKQPSAAPQTFERAKEKKAETRQRDEQTAINEAGGSGASARSTPAGPSSSSPAPSLPPAGAAASPPVASSPPPAVASVPPRTATAPASSGYSVASPPAAPREMPKAAMPEAKTLQAASAATVEANAQQARHAANYLQAASLYREAATLRRRENDPGAAAWNLAHAVECLSAVGRFDDARQVRDELLRLFPTESAPLSAARRALREVETSPIPAQR